MSTSNRISQTTLSARIQALSNGLTTYLADKTMLLNGKPVKCNDAVAALQQQLTLQAEAKTAHDVWQHAVAATKAQYTAAVKDLFPEIKKFVGSQFGVGSPTYLAMGFAVPKKPQTKVQTKAQAALQSKATRVARGTRGKKQKLAIKGVVAPATAPAATLPGSVPR